MHRFNRLVRNVSLGFLLLLWAGCSAPTEKHLPAPDILIILADDLGLETLTSYGGSSYITPNLDQIAREGMLLKHLYSMPLCTPSRVQLLTGKYNDETYRGFGILDTTFKTMPDYLKEAGYHSSIVGKWQLYGNSYQRKLAGQGGSTPPQAGFNYHYVWQMDTLGSRYYHPTITENDLTQTYQNAYGPDLFADKLVWLMKKPADGPQLFFYSMVLTHEPFLPAPEIPGAPDSTRSNPIHFSSMVSAMDREIGKLFRAAKEHPRPIILIFMSDNGTDKQIVSICNGDEVRGGKGLPNERGTHVPGLIWYPDSIPGNSVYEGMIDFTDLIPTLLDAAHKPHNQYDGPGHSFWPGLTGQSPPARDAIYVAYDPKWGPWEAATYAQDKIWKLTRDGSFYHLPTDPEELAPLADSMLDATALERKAYLQTLIANRGYQR